MKLDIRENIARAMPVQRRHKAGQSLTATEMQDADRQTVCLPGALKALLVPPLFYHTSVGTGKRFEG